MAHGESLPVRRRPPARRSQQDPPAGGEIATAALVAAFELPAYRGAGPLPWAASFRHNPIVFLLDTMTDAVNLWGSRGELLYRNRAAEQLGLGRCEETAHDVLLSSGRHLERRCCRFRCGHAEYFLEIIGEDMD
ncbi:hypothetical protein [Candidatus Nitrospira bockiana]